MADKKPKKAPAPALASMTKAKFVTIMQELNDLHQAADDGAMSVASGYKSLKKQGINLDALKLVRKLRGLDNPAKIQAFLSDFDRLRELAGFDDQQNLFEEDKTAPQKADSAKVVAIATGKAHVDGGRENAEKAPETAKKSNKTGAKTVAAKGGGKQAAAKAVLFDEGDGQGDETTAEVKARQAGLIAGKTGADYDNPYSEKGELRDAFHDGWLEGSESAAAEPGEKASA